MTNPMTKLSPFGEKSLTMVAGTFPEETQAQRVAESLRATPGLDGEISVVRPGDPLAARKFEPDQRGIWHTLIRSHVVLGVAGALVGLGLALWLILTPWAAAAGSPFTTLLIGAFFGTSLGMIGGGLLTLRPDHGLLIRQVRSRLRSGQWAVVVRPLGEAGATLAFDRLQAAGASPLRSF